MSSAELADIAAVLADPSRATMCIALLDGRAWTVGELARAASVAPSTASEHVGRLIDAGFVTIAAQGRHRYVRLANQQVAELIEGLSALVKPRPPKTLRATLRARRLAVARTCYDHLAGRLGVALRDGMIDAGLIDLRVGLAITPHGETILTELGVTVPSRPARPLLVDCLDWTERREHLRGTLPSALLHRALAAGWLERGAPRAIIMRPAGIGPFAQLGVALGELGDIAA